MTLASVDVPDEVFEELKRHFNTEQIVDLTATIALENMRARFNRALQIESDSFCRLPAHHPALASESVALRPLRYRFATSRRRLTGGAVSVLIHIFSARASLIISATLLWRAVTLDRRRGYPVRELKGNLTLKQWCATALVPAIALIAMAGCSHGPADTFGEREAVPILAAKVEQKTVVRYDPRDRPRRGFLDRRREGANQRPGHAGALPAGAGRQAGRPAVHDRSAAVRGRAATGAGESRQGSRAISRRPRPTSSATRLCSSRTSDRASNTIRSRRPPPRCRRRWKPTKPRCRPPS